jgi:hypothetical protein
MKKRRENGRVGSERSYFHEGKGTEIAAGFECSQVVPTVLLVKIGWRECGEMGSKFVLIIFNNSLPTSKETCSNISIHKDLWLKLSRKTATFY